MKTVIMLVDKQTLSSKQQLTSRSTA